MIIYKVEVVDGKKIIKFLIVTRKLNNTTPNPTLSEPSLIEDLNKPSPPKSKI